MSPECSRVMDSLGDVLPQELTSHVASCEDCQVLTGSFDQLHASLSVTTMSLDASAQSDDDGQTAASLAVARSFALETLAKQPQASPWWSELLLLLGVHAATGGVGFALLTHDGWMGNLASSGVVAGVALLILAAMGAGAYLAFTPRRRTVPGWAVGIAALGLGAGVVLAGSGQQTRPLLASVLGCVGMELAVTTVPLAVTLVLLCRSAFHPVRALAAGLAASSVSLLILHLRCAEGSPSHLLLGHITPWLALSGLAVLLRRLLPTRSYAP
ncbi:DUF1109 domain-containing protein [Myxococcus landrumensis]|uniref:DUF1109 domain-containing protein n=1 Tax=Myxococcus landrumensis TaxID=2813577 RepID=A0ABX7N3P4_9BACT|nr:DUF1109 domain-containing protein [Myxococcus landrumus]QSQ13059.1 DUF1109 domain-containing protein [Myxococcus landrumus]